MEVKRSAQCCLHPRLLKEYLFFSINKRLWRSDWRAALLLRRQSTALYLSPTLISCFQHLSICLAFPPLWLPHPVLSTSLSGDLWSKISAAVLPFSVDWQMIQPALWAPVGMATDQYPSLLPVSVHTNTHTRGHAHARKHAHKAFHVRG